MAISQKVRITMLAKFLNLWENSLFLSVQRESLGISLIKDRG